MSGELKEYLRFALQNVHKRGVRSALTLLGIIIGITAVVSLISLGQGLQNTLTEQFEALGTDKIIITPGGSFYGVGLEGIQLTEDDLDVVQREPGTHLSGGMLYKLARVKYGAETKFTFVTGLALGDAQTILEEFGNVKVVTGRKLTSGDRFSAQVGYGITQGDFFDKEVKVNSNVQIEGRKFRVVGGMSRIGNPQDDANIYIPLDTARDIFDEPEKLDIILVQVAEGLDVDIVGKRIESALRRSRDVKEGEEDFQVQTSQDLLDTFSTVFTIVQIVVLGIAGISLVVGGVNITNAMYTSVLERTREIGVMKAIGATNQNISTIFIAESAILGLIGGSIGTAIGIGIAKAGQAIAQSAGIIMQAYVSPTLIIGSLAFSVVVGMISGSLPAKNASELKPADSLRYE